MINDDRIFILVEVNDENSKSLFLLMEVNRDWRYQASK